MPVYQVTDSEASSAISELSIPAHPADLVRATTSGYRPRRRGRSRRHQPAIHQGTGRPPVQLGGAVPASSSTTLQPLINLIERKLAHSDRLASPHPPA